MALLAMVAIAVIFGIGTAAKVGLVFMGCGMVYALVNVFIIHAKVSAEAERNNALAAKKLEIKPQVTESDLMRRAREIEQKAKAQ